MNNQTRTFKFKRGRSRIIPALLALAAFTSWLPIASAYNFTFFGGRLGRPGVTTGVAGTNDFLYSWSRPDNGTITWWLDRNELQNANCNAACFAGLRALVQPELDKWALWLRVSFSEAPNMASADVVIRFINIPSGGADASSDATAGTTLTTALIRIDPDQHADWSTATARDDFCYTVLHEWGHVLGLGDLYFTDHGDASFEGEDFCDHGLPSGPPPAGGPGLPDTRTKADNVMETFGVKTLDNDSIHGAEWLWGCAGSNGIVTGELNFRTGLNNANTAAAHHGLTQTPATWTYRGSVASFVGAPKVTLYFAGIQGARDVGPGAWTPTIFPDRVEFDHAGAYEGNFKFELDCDQGPERYGDAIVAGATSTSFTATPAGGGPQLFPFDQVFGADCGEYYYLITCRNHTPDPVSTLSLELSGTAPLTIDPITIHAPGCFAPTISTSNNGITTTLTMDWGGLCIPPDATVAFIVKRPNSPIPLVYSTGTWEGAGGPLTIPDSEVVIDCFSDRVPNGIFWTVRKRTRYKPINPFYSPWFHPPGNCWFRWCCYSGLECFYRLDLYVFKSAGGRLFGARRCIPLTGWRKFGELPAGWTLVRQTWPPDGVIIEGPIGPPPNIPFFFGNGLPDPFLFSEETINSENRGETFRPGASFSGAFHGMRNSLNIIEEGIGTPPLPNMAFEAMMQNMAPGYCGAAELLIPLLNEIDFTMDQEPDPVLAAIRADIFAMQQALFLICNQMQTGVVLDPIPFDQMRQACENLGQNFAILPSLFPETGDRFPNAAENLFAIAEGFQFASLFVASNMYDGVNDLNERDQFLWTQVSRFPNELYQLAKAVDGHARLNVPILPPVFQSWQAEDQGEAVVTLVDRNQVYSGDILDEYKDRLSEFGRMVIRRPDRPDGNVDEGVPLRVRMKYPRHLSQVVDIPTIDGLNVDLPPLIAGDVNNDDCIDNVDVGMVQAAIGQGGPFAQQVPPTDVDGDGQVTPEDLLIVQSNVGACGQSLTDCDNNGVDDQLDIDNGTATDCDGNGIPDICDIMFGFSEDPCAPTCNCSGDINGDGVRNGRDIQGFVGCALGVSGPTSNCGCADMDGSGSVEIGSDVVLFVEAILTGGGC